MSEILIKKSVGRPRKYDNGLAKDYTNQSNYNQLYYQKNKEKRRIKNAEKNKEVIVCSCGRTVNKNKYESHLQTQLHHRFLQKKQSMEELNNNSIELNNIS
tara:strand:+ start:2974 stop:3276 length:303 start_codon:yes stop_codon:yes gene_type:complete